MCGIIGYIGEREAVPVLLEGLKRLEYRGYDSAGICVYDGKNLNFSKKKGKISELENNGDLGNIKGKLGIAHTRWATHGEPNEKNAHPHFDCKKEISLVHNGIIENYSVLKEMLEREGHRFESETDSEVLAHLIEKFYKDTVKDVNNSSTFVRPPLDSQGARRGNNSVLDYNLKKAVSEALKFVEGTFGIAVLNKNENKIVAARRGSPLIIGVGNKEMFVASDASAIISHTNKVVYLNDNEIAEINKENYNISNLNGEEVQNHVKELRFKIDQIEKGEYKHFMLKEIFEQPSSLENTLRGRLKEKEVKLTVKADLNSIKRIVIIGCGTSWHSALLGKYFIEKIAKMPVDVDYASEFRYRNPLIGTDDLVVVVSQSGETADSLAALKEAKQKGAKTLGIVNVVGSSISREVDSGIYIHAGPEIGVASTKAFVSQITSLLLLALYIKQKKEGIFDERIAEEIRKLPRLINKVLESNGKIKEIAERFKDSKNALYLGRGINFPIALEGALKLKEISYIHAEGYPAAEMKHGPIALVDENMPCIFVAPKDGSYEKILSNMQEIKARKGKIIVVSDSSENKLKELADEIIEVPSVSEEISPIINSIPLQLLAYHIADLKGLDVDKPRNLAKSVTVE